MVCALLRSCWRGGDNNIFLTEKRKGQKGLKGHKGAQEAKG